jgi:mannose-6-phosphate isomerase-like protein (cupin superfamily)
MKRIVTGHAADGKSIFVSDGSPTHVIHLDSFPGMEMSELWATRRDPVVPAARGEPTRERESLVPGRGETRFRVVVMPPQHVLAQAFREGVDLDRVRDEMAEKWPGLAESLEEDTPGMHTTDTVDYGIVISGEVSLELDDGRTVDLKPGDCVVQNGTRHAWRNGGEEPCVMAVVMVGAVRSP